MPLAPIALFVYNRPAHTRQTVEALLANDLAADSDLHVFSDAPKTDADINRVAKVREYVHGICGFRNVTILERDQNLGLASSIISGVARIVNEYGRVIVLEDDIVTSPHFLTYMNDGLDLYENEKKVASIHAYCYPIKEKLPDTFFLRGADCWGWATWKRAWQHFCPDGEKLLEQIKHRGELMNFDLEGKAFFSRMLKDQIDGKIDSWAVRWHASAFLDGLYTLYPGESLVINIGIDGSGTHCRRGYDFGKTFAGKAVNLQKQPIVENKQAVNAFGRFLQKQKKNSPLKNLIRHFLRMFKR